MVYSVSGALLFLLLWLLHLYSDSGGAHFCNTDIKLVHQAEMWLGNLE